MIQEVIDKISPCLEQVWEDAKEKIRISSFHGKAHEAFTEDENEAFWDMFDKSEEAQFVFMIKDLLGYPELLKELHETIQNSNNQENQDFFDSIINDAQKTLINFTRYNALRGKMSSQCELGRMYINGIDIVQDYKLASEWLTKSAKQGYMHGQYSLALLYYAGNGVEQSNELALEWLSKAAEQDLADAMFFIGIMFAKGEGVPQDDESSVDWLHKAAERDYPHAQYQLGIMYAQGRGVAQDMETAREWFVKAAEQGNENAKKVLQKF